VFHPFYGLMRGEPWFMRNHMVFVQNQFLGLSFTSENMAELMKTVTHTGIDSPDQIDYGKLGELVEVLDSFIRSF
ncbi:MAG: hypothetical protein WBI14_00005, partial [Anaerolineaceae bacterium]